MTDTSERVIHLMSDNIERLLTEVLRQRGSIDDLKSEIVDMRQKVSTLELGNSKMDMMIRAAMEWCEEWHDRCDKLTDSARRALYSQQKC